MQNVGVLILDIGLWRGRSRGKMAELQWCPLRFQDFYKSMIGEEIRAIITDRFPTLILSSPADDNYLQSKSPLQVTKHERGCGLDKLPEAQQCPILLLLGEVKCSADSGA